MDQTLPEGYRKRRSEEPNILICVIELKLASDIRFKLYSFHFLKKLIHQKFLDVLWRIPDNG
jgi:hypothetical protein